MGEKPLSIDEASGPPPDLSSAAGINTTRSNIKNAGSVATPAATATTGPVKPESTRPADPVPTDAGPPGLAVKEQGVKYGDAEGDAVPAGDTPGVAGAGQPIPGIDVIVKKHYPR